jgi:hypothetical protein
MMDYGNMFSRLQQFGQNRPQMGQHPMMQRLHGKFGGGMHQGGMGYGSGVAPPQTGFGGGFGGLQQQPQQQGMGMMQKPMGGLFNRFRG